MDRRSFLKQAAVTLIVAGGSIRRVSAQGEPEYGTGAAFEPWRSWQTAESGAGLNLVRAAILSSNAFNTQPWLFRVTPERIDIFADETRHLGAFDPFRRELHISLGCALENLCLGARAAGYGASVDLPSGVLRVLPQPAPRVAASVVLHPAAPTRSELYEAIPHRHTNRNAFVAGKLLAPDFLAELERVTREFPDVKVLAFTAERPRHALIEVIVGASSMMADERVQAGTRPWLRPTLDQWERARDGAYVGPSDAGRAAPVEDYAMLLRRAPLVGIIAVRDRYDRPQAIRAGRVWQRAHLLATARKVAARPANGAAEMIDHERDLRQTPRTSPALARITGARDWQPTFMFIMGHAEVPATASVRRAIEDVIL
jgi:hypothetical protein